MHIKDVKTAFKIMDVSYHPKEDDSKLIFNYLKNIKDENGKRLSNSILKSNVSRVYIIAVNNIIFKIGSSSDKGGIKGTLSIYKDGGVKGRPSIRSYGVFHLLMQEMKRGSKVEFYMIYQNEIMGSVKGLLKEYKNEKIHISPKIIEQRCLMDYKTVEKGKYPEWNFQEQNKDWPDIIKEIHSDIYKNSLNKNKK